MKETSDAYILCGGLGTRLHSITEDQIPKALASINGRPFLDYLMSNIAASGIISRFILCIGIHGEMIRARYGASFADIPIVYSKEDTPLGTGGALLQAIHAYALNNKPVFAMNGDCIAVCCLHSLRNSLTSQDATSGMLASLALARVPDASRFGIVTHHKTIITAFGAQGHAGEAMINAGRYMLYPSRFKAVTPSSSAFSIEHDIFTPGATSRTLAAYPYEGGFLDIGIPEDYALAQSYIPKHVPLQRITI